MALALVEHGRTNQLDIERNRLTAHLQASNSLAPVASVYAFLENARDSYRLCSSGACGSRIQRADYQFVVIPGQSTASNGPASDVYHVRCFERILGAQLAQYLEFLLPTNCHSWSERGLLAYESNSSIILDYGATAILEEFKARQGVYTQYTFWREMDDHTTWSLNRISKPTEPAIDPVDNWSIITDYVENGNGLADGLTRWKTAKVSAQTQR
ncbi:uncharacterized protein KY384_000157 [Bacidia gigantensis]|uniref:uncharacterized protein n=1 Tax=Bacidia gigantensis TaxID=2732470 RepID=UPI001D04C75C|nr:uncharacterized protein KY384_000157 [Bacidia gigantensis]KAG8526164.1 hypothetical protein KY384_000157 [Bacidia gigantensis]